jgi:hypothetical protein
MEFTLPALLITFKKDRISSFKIRNSTFVNRQPETMVRLHTILKLIICLVLLGYCQYSAFAVQEFEPDMEAQWHRFLADDSLKFPVVSFPYDHCFRSAAKSFDLPLSLLVAVARGESGFDPSARSDRSCYGLMQIQWPGTAEHLGIRRLAALYEPCTNIRAGAKYLRELLNRYGQNLHLALAAYNYGPGRIRQNSKPRGIPRGAQWYSGYIYHHLEYVTQGAGAASDTDRPAGKMGYGREKRLVLITFSQPYRANAYYRHLRKKAPSLNLDWYRIGLGRFQVVMLYTDTQTLESGRRKLRNIGVTVPGRWLQ